MDVNDAIGECAAMVNIPLVRFAGSRSADGTPWGEMGLLAEAMVVSSLF
jgi:hypothetical protein